MKTLQQLEQLEKLRHDTGLRGEMLLLAYDAKYKSFTQCVAPHYSTLGYYRVKRADLYKEVAPVEVRTIEFGADEPSGFNMDRSGLDRQEF